MDQEIKDRFEKTDAQYESLRKSILDLTQTMSKAFKTIDQNFEAMDDRLNSLDKKVDTLIFESNEGFGKVGDNLKSVKEKLGELTTEVVKIQKVSNYSEQYENLLSISK
jgi:hypothetical protein